MVNRQLEGGQALRMFEKESGAIPLLGTLLQNRIFDRLPSRTFKSSKFCTQQYEGPDNIARRFVAS